MISPLSSVKLILKTLLVVGLLASGLAIGYYVFSKHQQPQMPPIIIGEPVVMRTKGGLLEVSKVVSIESVTQNFPGLIFPTVVTITAPATYRYHVELAPEWKFAQQGNMLIAISPPVRPSRPVAIDTAGMTVNSTLPFTNAAKLAAVTQLTPILNEKFQAYLPRQREDARKTIAEFVSKWVLDQGRFKDAKNLNVVVLFPDEPVNEILKVGLYPVLLPKELNPLTSSPSK